MPRKLVLAIVLACCAMAAGQDAKKPTAKDKAAEKTTVVWQDNDWRVPSHNLSGLHVFVGGMEWRPVVAKGGRPIFVRWDGRKWVASTGTRLPIKVQRGLLSEEWNPSLEPLPNEPPEIELHLHTLKVGQVGVIARTIDRPVARAGLMPFIYTITVVQIIDEKNMLITAGGAKTVWVSGYSTKNIADDDEVLLPGKWKVAGTKTNHAALGNSTVYVIEPFLGEK